jgi:GNAT superfamily N-acetyltransferase
LKQIDSRVDLEAVLSLIRASFAYMDGRIDPPSSVHRLTVESLAAHPGEIWVIEEDDPVACVVLTPKPDALYVGKLAVETRMRGRGLARRLLNHAKTRARHLGLPALELQVRVELAENIATFSAMGFTKTGKTAHEGYTRPTSITMRKDVT